MIYIFVDEIRLFHVPVPFYISIQFFAFSHVNVVVVLQFFRIHPPPAFGSSSNLEALGLETSEGDVRSTNDTDHSVHLISR
jgi:hypothetical protein